ncbi:MAG: MG2 domain-containing protein, partial [Pirellulales bacterium]
MKFKHLATKKLLAIAFLAGCVGSFVALRAEEDGPVDRPAQWKKVEAALKKGLPKTAIKALEPIITSALADKEHAEAIKAIGQRIALEGNIQGNKPEEKITRMRAEIEKAPKEMVPVMEAIMANWYWHYFQANRWRFMQRTQTGTPPGEDFTTWDLKRIFTEIDKQFVKALSAAPQLKKIPVADYDALLSKGTAPDAYRPTLWDFLIHNAIEFYSSAEQAGAKPQDSFVLKSDSPIFASADEFMRWKMESSDKTSPTFKAIRLYQHLLAFHRKDDDKSAFIDADLLRLNFGFNKAFGEEKNPRYKAALKRFVEKWADHQISARGLHRWATALQQEGELVEAHKIASRGAKIWPKTVGGRRCHNLIQQIEAKQSSITVERVWNDPLPQVFVNYKNLTKIYLRAVPYDFEQLLKGRQYRPESLDKNGQKALLAKQPAKAWSADLPATDDYHQRVEEIAVPKDLKPGFYFLAASHREDFGATNNVVTFTDFWVSDLAIVMRVRNGEGVIEGFVLNAISGEPISGATVTAWARTRNQVRTAQPPIKTDENGLFRFNADNNSSYLLLASHKDQQLASSNDYAGRRHDLRARPYERTIFFTDRSLYRPGQTIQFKGICIRVDAEADDYETIPNRKLAVLFKDRNGKDIERVEVRSNDYGSFSGSVTAPTDRLTGHMSLSAADGPGGSAGFNVEEYKRPKFQVKLDRPEVAAKLNAKVSLKGTATAYTGAAINDAQIRYRVVRQVRYPYWWGWYYWWRAPRGESQEIAHGNLRTEADGTFTIEFTAKADPSVPEKDEPTFHFAVYADVTDITGETRSGETSVNVGYTALQATLSSESWLTDDKAVPVNIRTTTLDGIGQKAEGSLKIYSLKQPEKVHRRKLSNHRHVRHGGKMQEPVPDPSNPNSWELGEVVAERGFTTDAEGNASYKFELKAGAYRATLETQDRFGKKVTAMLPLQVLDPDANKFNIKIPSLVAAPKWSLEPGEEFSAIWGSGYDKARAFIEIEHRRKTVKSFWTKADETQVTVTQAIGEAMRGGFTFRVTMVRENRAYLDQRQVNVPWTNKNLKVRWEHFVSKLKPAAKETWTAIITGPDAKKAVAEMVAGLYDESLDAYKPHAWQTGFGVFRRDHSHLYSQFANAMKNMHHLHGSWPGRQQGDTGLSYRAFPYQMIAYLQGYAFGKNGVRSRFSRNAAAALQAEAAFDSADQSAHQDKALRKVAGAATREGQGAGQAAGPAAGGPDLSKVSARKNLNETAFFFPHL